MKWNTILYDQAHDFVSKYGEELIDMLSPRAGERILDLGCGTGDLADIISKSGALVTGLDSSPQMIESAARKYPHIQFDFKSADDFRYEQPFDALFSNATLHWVTNAANAARCMNKALKPKGRFVAEFGGRGNVDLIIKALRHALTKAGYPGSANKKVWYFPSLSEYCSLLEANGFRVLYAAHYDRQTALKNANGIQNWLTMFGQPYLQGLNDAAIEDLLQDVEEQLMATHYRNGTWYADYVRLRIIAIKVEEAG